MGWNTCMYVYKGTGSFVLTCSCVVGYTRVSVWISRGIQYWQVLAITRLAGE